MTESELERRIVEIANDRESAASVLLDRAVAVLTDALTSGHSIPPVARQLCRAQPSMAPLWNAAAAAIMAEGRPPQFERFVHRVRSARRAMVRLAVASLTDEASPDPLHLVTMSMSQSVIAAVAAVAEHRGVRISCSESRPRLEGRTLASLFAARRIPVTLYVDAALAHALDTADAVLLGADAVGPDWFLNKSGSRMLAAAAAHQGVPVYVVATRDKFVGAAISARLMVREEAAGEIWEAPPAGVGVRNPYFERTPLDMVTAVISDLGMLGTGMIADACEAAADPAAVQLLLELT